MTEKTEYPESEYICEIKIDHNESWTNKSCKLHYPHIIFRGQREPNRLIPKFHRLENTDYEAYIKSIASDNGDPPDINESLISKKDYAEHLIIKRFYELSNSHGLIMHKPEPTWMNHRIGHDEIMEMINTDLYRYDSIKQIAAIAQHHDCPTRLLDWTYSFDVASYFATIPGYDGDRTVWALNLSFIHIMEDCFSDWKNNPLEIVIPNYYGNSNIVLQRGVFSLLPKNENDVIDYILKMCQNHKEDVDLFLYRNKEKKDWTYPIYKFIIDKNSSDIIYDHLRLNGKGADSLFSGYYGVSKTINDQKKRVSLQRF